MKATILNMPGIHNSGPEHWQTLWEREDASIRRIQVDDWNAPVCAAWMNAIEAAVSAADAPVVLVAHSLGCLPVVEWALDRCGGRVRAAMLVSVPDPLGTRFPVEARGFLQPRLQPLPFASIVVSSEDDPYGSQAFARRCADAWGSRFVNAGKAGHINVASNLGRWDAGRLLLESLAGS